MKYVLVTGASSGIGYDACRYLLLKGFSVFGTVRTQEDKERLENDFPKNFEAVFLDVLSDESINQLTRILETKLKETGLYGLVNNAGVATGGPLIHVEIEDFNLQMQTNLYSVFKLTNALSNLLGAGFETSYKPGRIINISSVSGLINTPMLGPYCISKHALESMTDIYRRELSIYGIKVVLIEPGPIKTPIWSKSVPPKNPVSGTDFENIYYLFQKQVLKTEENALPVEQVSKKIYKGLTKQSPANRYIVSKTALIIKIINQWVPSKWMDQLFSRQLSKTLHPKTSKS